MTTNSGLSDGKIELRRFRGGHGKLHPDGERNVILVLDLGFSERGLERDGPINGFLAAIDDVLFDERRESAKDIGLERGDFVLYSFAQSPSTPMRLNCAVCFAIHDSANASQSARSSAVVTRFILFAEFAGDFLFDRQPVAVPARNIGRPESAHRFVAEDDFLQRLVERVAEMEIAVRERRSVVQHETFARRRVLALDRLVKAGLFPVGNPSWLALRKTRAHREVRFRKLQSVFQIVGHAKEKCARVGVVGSESRGEVTRLPGRRADLRLSCIWRLEFYLSGDSCGVKFR